MLYVNYLLYLTHILKSEDIPICSHKNLQISNMRNWNRGNDLRQGSAVLKGAAD